MLLPWMRQAASGAVSRYCIVRGESTSVANLRFSACTLKARLKSSLSRSMSLVRPTASVSLPKTPAGTHLERRQEGRAASTAVTASGGSSMCAALRVGGVRLVGVVERDEVATALVAAHHVARPAPVAVAERIAGPPIHQRQVLVDVLPASGQAERHDPFAPFAVEQVAADQHGGDPDAEQPGQQGREVGHRSPIGALSASHECPDPAESTTFSMLAVGSPGVQAW